MVLFTESKWIEAKEAETEAKRLRMEIEDQLLSLWGVPESEEGSKTWEQEGYKLKLTFRMNRSVNADLLKELAVENGLTSELDSLVRWKAELNKRNWDNAAAEITGPLSEAITVKPGRASFSIVKGE